MKTQDWNAALAPITNDAPKILIADDDEATRILLRMAMTQWGYQVIEAKDGEEAWKILQESDPPQILTLDWLMPKLDGVSLCKRIDKELNFRPYIIFLTKMAGTENVIKGLEAGADEFILKPFDLPELRIRVFAGERIIKYRNQLAEQSKQLQNYVASIKKSALEQVNQLFPFKDIIILLQELHNNLDEVNKNLSEDKEKNTSSLKILEDTQGKLNNIIDIIKGFTGEKKSETTTESTAPENHDTLINMQRMKAFFGNNSAGIQEFIKTFINLSSEQLKEIQKAVQNQDEKSAKYFFHLLGSAAGNSGVTQIYDTCGLAEQKISKEDWKGAEESYQQLKEILVKLQQELDGLKK